jgi:uncharacterized protein (TIGR02996 family)
MGLFDSMCCESGLIIDSEQQLIVIAERPTGWIPLGLPIAGTNDRGGTMDMPKKLDANMKHVVGFAKKLAYADDRVTPKSVKLDGLLDEIRGDGSGATWQGKRVSFALIDGPVFAAIVTAVAADGETAWKRYAQVGLGVPELPLPRRGKVKAKKPRIDVTMKRLCEAILEAPGDAGPRKVYVDHLLEQDDPRGKLLAMLPAIGKASFDTLAALALPEAAAVYGDADKAALKPAVAQLVRFLAWGTQLGPACGEGQFFGYETSNPEYEKLDGWVKPYCVRARTKYAGMPELLRAVDANERAFRERGED